MKNIVKGITATVVIASGLMINGQASAATNPSWESMVVLKNQPTITFVCNGRSATATPDDLGLMIGRNTIDGEDLLVYQWDEDKFSQGVVQIEKDLSLRPPTRGEVRWKNGEFVTVPGNKGYGIDEEALLSQMVYGPIKESYWVPIETLDPLPAKEESVEKVLIGDYTTTFVNNADRTHNLRLSCEAFDGMILEPGDVFSFNGVVGQRTAKKGYREAKVIMNGEFVDGLGGGICQISSTLYNAVLEAGLQIVERHSHSLGITYVPPGKDATVAYGSLDFKFKNNSNHKIEMGYEMKGQKVTLSLYALPN